MPTDDNSLTFGPYRLHPVQGLTHGDREIHLTPKSLAVLYMLVRRSGEIVTKKELFDTAWSGRSVTDAALSSCIRELRQALGDDARKPSYLETVHRRGFRFITPCSKFDEGGEVPRPDNLRHERELEALGVYLDRARRGSVQLVAVQGDEDSGRSVLVDAFAARAADSAAWQVGRGACDELTGSGDPYRPLLEALTALCLQPGGALIVSQLRHHAPTWLGELTTVLQPGDLEAQRRITSGVMTVRLHRELDAALGAIANGRPLLLILEDLQWSDEGTLDWLAGLEQRVTAPLLLLVTHTSDVRPDVGHTLVLEANAEGATGRRLDRLSYRDREVLEAAGTIGIRFSEAEVARVLDMPRDTVADALAGLAAAGDVVCDMGEGRPTDAMGGRRYRFGSRMRRAQLLERLPVQSSRRLHRRVARSLESALGESASERSPELAARYERAYDVARAVGSYHEAAVLCRRRGARRIARTHLRRALALLAGIPGSVERNRWDALLHAAIGGDLADEKGPGNVEAGDCYARALNLVEEMQASRDSFAILWQIWVFQFQRGPVAKAHELAVRLSEIAHEIDDPALELCAHHAFWCTALLLGDVRNVLRHTQEGLALCGSGLDGEPPITFGCSVHDSGVSNHHAAVCAGFFGAWAKALAGRRQEVRRSIDATIAHARDFGHPSSLAAALVKSAGALTACGDAVNVRRYASEGAAISREHGFAVFDAWGSIYEGWAAARLGDTRRGLDMMYEGLAAFRGTGLWLFRSHQLALAADVELENKMYDAAARSLDEAFSTANGVGDRLAAAELHRLRGEHAIATARTPDDLAVGVRDLRVGFDLATATGAEHVRARAARSLERFDGVAGRRKEDSSGQLGDVTVLGDWRAGRDA